MFFWRPAAYFTRQNQKFSRPTAYLTKKLGSLSRTPLLWVLKLCCHYFSRFSDGMRCLDVLNAVAPKSRVDILSLEKVCLYFKVFESCESHVGMGGVLRQTYNMNCCVTLKNNNSLNDCMAYPAINFAL